MDNIRIVLAYIVGIAVNIGYYLYFLANYRCYVIETGDQRSNQGYGIEKWGDVSPAECYLKHGLLSPTAVMLVIMAFMIRVLVKDQAGASKIAIYFVGYSVLFFAVIQYLVFKTQFNEVYN